MDAYQKLKLKNPKKVQDLPKEPFLAILKPTSTTYSLYTENDATDESWDMEVYDDEEEWQAEIKRLISDKSVYKKEFVPVKIMPAKVEVDIKINANF